MPPELCVMQHQAVPMPPEPCVTQHQATTWHTVCLIAAAALGQHYSTAPAGRGQGANNLCRQATPHNNSSLSHSLNHMWCCNPATITHNTHPGWGRCSSPAVTAVSAAAAPSPPSCAPCSGPYNPGGCSRPPAALQPWRPCEQPGAPTWYHQCTGLDNTPQHVSSGPAPATCRFYLLLHTSLAMLQQQRIRLPLSSLAGTRQQLAGAIRWCMC
jgi:hypothetical protein